MKKNRLLKELFKGFLTAVTISSFFTLTSFAGEWIRDSMGWWYMLGQTHYYAGGIQGIDGIYYMFNNDGYMLTGWQMTTDGDWYYAHPDGRMAINEWIGDYYLGSELKMLKSTYVGQYYVGSDGKWIPNAQTVTNDIYGYYSTEGFYGHTPNHLIQMDVYMDNSNSGYDIVIDFGLFDSMGNTGNYYDKANPNGDKIHAILSYGNQGIQAWGPAESDGKEYHITYDGVDTIILYWKQNNSWNISGEGSGGVKFKKRSGGGGVG